jgi:hypothetical protein
VRDEVLRADALDAVRITRWLRVEADDHELAALDLGHHHKVPASQFARVYGFAPQKGQNNRQGVRDRRDRLRAALDHGVRDEKILRRDRLRAEADAAWATQHDDELRALAAALLDHAEHLADLSDGDEDVTDWLAELHEQHHHGTRPDSYLTTIRLTADAPADAIPAAGIPGPAAEALRGWQALAELHHHQVVIPAQRKHRARKARTQPI